MKTLDVISIISCEANIPTAARLFAITDESKRVKIVKKVETMFVTFAKELGIEEEAIEEALDNGYYECQKSYNSISIVCTTIKV